MSYQDLLQASKDGNLVNVVAYSNAPNLTKQYLSRCVSEACIYGHLDVVKYFIETLGCNRHDYRDSDIYIVWATEYNHLDILKYLMSKGCKPSSRGYNVFRCAISYGYIDILKYIYNRDGFPCIQDRVHNGIYADAIHNAMTKGYWSSVIYSEHHFFLRNRPFPTEKTPNGRSTPDPVYTPMPCFQSFDSYKICILILSLGYSNSVTNEFTSDSTWDNNCMKIVALFAF